MRKYLYSLGMLVVWVGPAAAQENAEPAVEADIVIADLRRDNVITVVASGVDQRASASGQQISVIGAGEIAQVQGADLARVVQRLPGVTISRNGGLGSFTAVRVRGADAEQLLVLVDGVRVADTASPGNGFDSGTLLAGGISKIELLRSSNSVVWGSQAIGGVMAVTTLGKGQAAMPAASLSLEAGSHASARADAIAALASGPLTLRAQGGWVETAGISAAATGTERDGFRQWRAGGRAELIVADGLTAFAHARAAQGRLDLDGFAPPDYALFTDTAEYQHTRQLAGGAGLRGQAAGLDITAAWSLARTNRDSFDPQYGPAPTYITQGQSQRAELRGLWQAREWRLAFGAEREWSRFSSSYDAQKRSATSGVYLQGGFDGAVVANAGVRVEHHARFGTISVMGADLAIPLGDWRITASLGQGFKAPSLFQLHSDYGNAALKPERSTGLDLGLSRGDRNAPGYLAVTLFRRDSRDLIDFVSCYGLTTGICTNRPYGTYDNVGRARADGVEAEAFLLAHDALALRAAYSFTRASNRETGRRLARRPRHAATLTLDWDREPVAFGADLRLVSASFDDAFNSVRLPGHAVLDLRGSLQVAENVVLFGRIENTWNERYQTAAGYGTPGRTLHIGARAMW
ncbi:MAG: TonB-dependent receptor [Croceibacterium sp.]